MNPTVKNIIAVVVGFVVGSAFNLAIVALKISRSDKPTVAWIIGGLFLAGGIYAASVIPAPTWFMALDIVGAYIPMAWLAIRIAGNSAEGD